MDSVRRYLAAPRALDSLQSPAQLCSPLLALVGDAFRLLGASQPEHLVDLAAADFEGDELAALRPLERRRLLRHVVALAKLDGRPTALEEPRDSSECLDDHESPIKLRVGGDDDDALDAPAALRPDDFCSPSNSPPRRAIDFLPPAPAPPDPRFAPKP